MIGPEHWFDLFVTGALFLVLFCACLALMGK